MYEMCQYICANNNDGCGSTMNHDRTDDGSIHDKRDTIDPKASIATPSPATSACLAARIDGGTSRHGPNDDDENDRDDSSDSDSDSDSSEDKLDLRCARLGSTSSTNESNSVSDFSSWLLVSCHKSGEALVWDLNARTVTGRLEGANRGQDAGLAVRRIHSSSPTVDSNATPTSSAVYQTRGPNGAVFVHSLQRDDCPVVTTFDTRSETFCGVAPCWGDANLMAVPSESSCAANILDLRSPTPIVTVQVRESSPWANSNMLMSLAMSVDANGHPILACGMDGGTVSFHDFVRTPRTDVEFQLSDADPVLALDMAPSNLPHKQSQQPISSLVAVAGLAGTPEDVEKLPKPEQGRVCLIKAICDPLESSWKVRERARMLTCRIDEYSSGKPTAAVCRLQPREGRLVAVGGWDKRVRIYDRSNGNQLAILRGHRSSILAVDWAPDADESGVLASCDKNNVHIWRQSFGKKR